MGRLNAGHTDSLFCDRVLYLRGKNCYSSYEQQLATVIELCLSGWYSTLPFPLHWRGSGLFYYVASTNYRLEVRIGDDHVDEIF
jgi:hypothetical protein